MARRSRPTAAAAAAAAGKADAKNPPPQVSLRFLFANHDEVKPIELTVPLSTTVGGLKERLRAQWPEGLPTAQHDGEDDSTVAAAAPATPDPKQELRQRRRRRASGPVEPQTPRSVASPPPPGPAVVGAPAAPAGGGVGDSGAATDDEQEDEEEDEEEGGLVVTPITPALRVAVEPGRIRLVCLGRGLDDDGKMLSQYHIPSFEYATPIQVMVRPAGVRGGGGRRSPKSLEEGQEGGQEAVGPLGCCGCSVM